MLSRVVNHFSRYKLVCSFLLAFCFVLESKAQLIANFSIEKNQACEPATVTFTDESIGSNYTRSWDLGNGNMSGNLAVTSGLYNAGTYSVTLTITNGSVTSTSTHTFSIAEHPTAQFSISEIALKCAPVNVTFANESTDPEGSALTYFWVFGDGGTSEAKDPVYEYTRPGQYPVTLTVTNAFGCTDTEVKNGAVTISGLEATFETSATGSLCSAPASIDFTSTSEDAVTHEWDFGDGTTGTGQEISHTYNETGQFKAVLKVKDAGGCEDVAEKTVYIGTEGGVDFTISDDKVCIGSIVTLSTTISSVVESFVWTFGDGSSESTILNPQKQYTAAGIYKITLTVQLAGKECESVISKEIQVVANAKPDFSYTVPCSKEVSFSNKSVNSVSWEWQFGDGHTSTEKSPKHLYTSSGTFLVKLTAVNSSGCSVTREKSVKIVGLPVAAFTPNSEQDCSLPSLSGCAPFDLSLENHSSGQVPITEVLWTFGDGTTSDSEEFNVDHTYAAGEFTLKLTVKDSLGCSNSISRQVNVAAVTPVADFEMDFPVACAGQEITFTNLSSNADFFCWDFGDSTRAIGKNVKHRYTVPGTYDITLKAKNAGCEHEIVRIGAVVVNEPLANFSYEKTCEQPFDVTFFNEAEGYDKFVWDFGDGAKDSTNLIPLHQYSLFGDYTVSLTVSNASTGCTVKAAGVVTIQKVKANFSVDNFNPCLNETIHISDNSDFAAMLIWDLGNGIQTNGEFLTTSYAVPGTYTISLRAVDSEQCFHDTTATIEVPDIIANYSHSSHSLCDSLQVNFTDLTVADPPITSWSWDFGDGETSSEQHPEHFYRDKISYNVSVTFSNSENETCSLVRYNDVTFAVPIPGIWVNSDFQYCVGDTIMFYNSSIGANYYNWDFGNGTAATTAQGSASYAVASDYSVTLQATDDFNCTEEISITIYVTKPEANFSATDTFGECPPLITRFTDTSDGATSWVWSFGDGQTSLLANPANVYQRPGEFDVTLMVADNNGCKDTITVDKVVTLGGPDGTISVSPLTVCADDTVNFSAVATNTVTYRWDFGDGNVNDFASPNTTHHYTQPGNAIVSAVFIDQNGCEVSALGQYTIQALGTPEVAFTYAHQYPFEDEEISLQGTSESAISFEWFADGNLVGTGESSTVIFEEPGLKNVTFRGYNELGCDRDTTQQILVQANINTIPNVFTPNNDDRNQAFEIPRVREGYWNLQVYNRWGELVHEDDHYQSDWQARGLASGVYYYILKNAYRDKTFKGYVHVVY